MSSNVQHTCNITFSLWINHNFHYGDIFAHQLESECTEFTKTNLLLHIGVLLWCSPALQAIAKINARMRVEQRPFPWTHKRHPISHLNRQVCCIYCVYFVKTLSGIAGSYNIFQCRIWKAEQFTETEMSSFWRNFNHWLHRKLSKWQLSVQSVIKISSKWQHFRFSVEIDFQT